jgi:hypothetical protein
VWYGFAKTDRWDDEVWGSLVQSARAYELTPLSVDERGCDALVGADGVGSIVWWWWFGGM